MSVRREGVVLEFIFLSVPNEYMRKACGEVSKESLCDLVLGLNEPCKILWHKLDTDEKTTHANPRAMTRSA